MSTIAPLDPIPLPKRRHTGLIAAAIAVPVVLAGGAAFAWQSLDGGGAQPADVFPADSLAYVRIDADPSASQKIKLFKLIKKSPELAKNIGIKGDDQDLRHKLVDELLTDCDIDYATDIKPWLGNRMGAALDSTGESGTIALQVTDEKAARKGAALVAGCLGMDEPGVAFSKGYAIVGIDQASADATVKAAAKASLADNATFIEDHSDLGDAGIASGWMHAAKLGKTLAAGTSGGDSAADILGGPRSGAFALRAEDNAIELAGIFHTAVDLPKPTITNGLNTLPTNAVLGASISGGGDQIDEQWPSIADAFKDFGFDAIVSSFEASTGLDLPADLSTLLGENLTLAVGDRNLDTLDSLEGPDQLSEFDVALTLHSDPAKATAVAMKIADQVEQLVGFKLAVAKTDDGAVIATNDGFAKSFNTGKSLKDSEAFKSVIDAEAPTYTSVYLDIAEVVQIAGDTDLPADVADEILDAKALKAFGWSGVRENSRVVRTIFKLSFN